MTEAAVSFAGNLTDDPEVRYTEAGVARAMFRVAVSGRRAQEASFVAVVVWRDQAEHAGESLSKAAGWWSWASSSSAAGPPRTAAPARWSRSWPRSWGRAFGGRPPRRAGRPGRAKPGGLPGHETPAAAAAGAGDRPHQPNVLKITDGSLAGVPQSRHRAIHSHPARGATIGARRGPMDPSTSPILIFGALAGALLVGLGLAWLFDPDRRSWRRAPVASENVNREPWFLGWLVAFFIGRPYSGGGGGGEDGGGDAGGGGGS